mmetsp:Transcript_9158/g.21594  ORF Transcript_9158/g.21594 Transcript_9158/m.21594 type:complete len:375 (+) Transcript_9158:347-1471(+)|eukprot:CAMPEP_0182566922 /NCGR_PEP_ID=MMETSP1324-20130603/8268_1 /TAXON_ID=236786 /ORGANISM="Florenciella sp., Strain RCC1587" /LENGTH=374 /DNA_ID=CAMNT_0024780815 /DNA_START=333 /DNA_END=1457 /DNA_ORIENTATION=+
MATVLGGGGTETQGPPPGLPPGLNRASDSPLSASVPVENDSIAQSASHWMKESTKQQKPRKPVIEIVDNYSPTSSQPLEGTAGARQCVRNINGKVSPEPRRFFENVPTAPEMSPMSVSRHNGRAIGFEPIVVTPSYVHHPGPTLAAYQQCRNVRPEAGDSEKLNEKIGDENDSNFGDGACGIDNDGNSGCGTAGEVFAGTSVDDARSSSRSSNICSSSGGGSGGSGAISDVLPPIPKTRNGLESLLVVPPKLPSAKQAGVSVDKQHMTPVTKEQAARLVPPRAASVPQGTGILTKTLDGNNPLRSPLDLPANDCHAVPVIGDGDPAKARTPMSLTRRGGYAFGSGGCDPVVSPTAVVLTKSKRGDLDQQGRGGI